MKKISSVRVENRFGHGAIKTNRLVAKIRHIKRPLARASSPFNWTLGFDVEKKTGPITRKNQGSNDSCGGQAGSYFLEVQRRLQGLTEVECSAKSVYAPIAYPGGGTTVKDLETQVGARGANLESQVPSYDTQGNPLSEYLMEDSSWQTPTFIADAAKRAGYLPVSVSIDMDSIAWAIQTYGGVIWEIQGQNNGTWLSSYPVPPSKQNPNEIWAHFMCGKSATQVDGVNQLGFFESYGPDIGDGGLQYFRQDYLDSGYIVDVFTFVPAAQIEPLPTNTSVWASIINYFRSLWGLPVAAVVV